MVKVPHARIGDILTEQNILSSSRPLKYLKLKKLSEPEISDSRSLICIGKEAKTCLFFLFFLNSNPDLFQGIGLLDILSDPPHPKSSYVWTNIILRFTAGDS